jgi:hypothetical protein
MQSRKRPVYSLLSFICLTLLGIAGVSLLMRIAMLVLSLSGYALIDPEGRDLMIATLVPDFLMVFVFTVTSAFSFKNKSLAGITAVIILFIIGFSILPRLMFAEDYIRIKGTEFAVTSHIYKIPDENFDGLSVRVYQKVFPYVFSQGKEYRNNSAQAEKSQSELLRRSYEVGEENILIIGEWKIPLEQYGEGGET